MALVVCIETAAPLSMVAFGDGTGVLHEETPGSGRTEGPVFLHGALRRGLDAIGAAAGDIEAVAVDLGPGGLTATRGGVTFANTLSWALGRPLVPLDYFDLVARETGSPSTVICIRPTTGGRGFFQERRGGRCGPLVVDDLARLVRHAVASRKAFVLVGVVPEEVASLFPGAAVGARTVTASTLVAEAGEALAGGRFSREPVVPLTTLSPAVVSLSEVGGDG